MTTSPIQLSVENAGVVEVLRRTKDRRFDIVLAVEKPETGTLTVELNHKGSRITDDRAQEVVDTFDRL